MKSIVIVGGLGRVGFPLGLVIADSDIPVSLLDRDKERGAIVRNGTIPFLESGAQALLDKVLGVRLNVAASPAVVADADTVVITIGTPLDEHQNPRLSAVIRCIEELLPYLRDGQHIMLRSTVFPGTTRRVDAFLREAGKRIDVSFCPERIVQGHAVRELRELPHIVSGCTPEAVARAKAIFQRVSGSGLYDACVVVTPEEAELTKLFLNSWRYIQFAAANQFYGIAEKNGASYEAIRHAMTWRYPRGESLPGPGFAAGPCLVKDTMQLAAADPTGFQLGQAARLVNEGLPKLMAEKVRGAATVGILGMAFKADNDDTRDSLSFKLRKILEFQGARVLCSDEFATGDGWVTKERLVEECDAVIVAVGHSSYRGLKVPAGKTIVDLWGCVEVAA